MARERTVESRLKSRIEAIGGVCEKFSGVTRGEPDNAIPRIFRCCPHLRRSVTIDTLSHCQGQFLIVSHGESAREGDQLSQILRVFGP